MYYMLCSDGNRLYESSSAQANNILIGDHVCVAAAAPPAAAATTAIASFTRIMKSDSAQRADVDNSFLLLVLLFLLLVLFFLLLLLFRRPLSVRPISSGR